MEKIFRSWVVALTNFMARDILWTSKKLGQCPCGQSCDNLGPLWCKHTSDVLVNSGLQSSGEAIIYLP